MCVYIYKLISGGEKDRVSDLTSLGSQVQLGRYMYTTGSLLYCTILWGPLGRKETFNLGRIKYAANNFVRAYNVSQVECPLYQCLGASRIRTGQVARLQIDRVIRI